MLEYLAYNTRTRARTCGFPGPSAMRKCKIINFITLTTIGLLHIELGARGVQVIK